MGKVSGEQYMSMAGIIVAAYFAKRDQKSIEELEEEKKWQSN